ncbi:MAG: secretin N-terminal domain-containing protein [Verrucomicrobiia bacterium]
MKTFTWTAFSLACATSLALITRAQPAEPPASVVQASDQPPTAEASPARAEESPPAGSEVVQPTTPAPEPAAPAQPGEPVARRPVNGSNELRLNFRNAPLETVLNYLSEAAGFIIELQVSDVKGRVTVWSNQPVTREEALDLLNSALDKNGYTAVRNGRTLTIWTKDEAKKRDLPVKSGNRPEDIPKNDEMVTQIIPVRFISAVQVARDLQPLLPDEATMSANEGGNSLILTDTQVSIRRMAQIIQALDTAISSVSSVRVFPLQYADAKAVATVIKDVFAPQETSRSGGNAAASRFMNQFRGPGGMAGGGRPGAPGTEAFAGSAGGGRAPTPRVVAVSEERSNCVVVSAPDEQMPIIQQMIDELDAPVEDVTEIRVFRLKYADAQETSDLLNNLFSAANSGTSGQGLGGRFQFGGRRPGMFGQNTAAADPSSRMLKQTQVVSVPDLRTGSVVVSASRDLMVQIEGMVADLDSDAAKKQEVFVFDVQNTDPQAVQDILQSLFPAPTYSGGTTARSTSRNQTGVGNQLNTRATQNLNRGGSGGGNTGFGNTSSGFGGASGGFSR